jgi:hypothetical protein
MKMSAFHHDRCGTCACSATPVGDPTDATTMPSPDCVQMPVVSSIDQRAM